MQEISASELKSRLEAGEELSVVDVRNAGEYQSWHILGSRNLPVYDALQRGDAEPLLRQSGSLSRGRPIVTVCRAGVISREAAEILRSLGYDASSLSGGMRGWGDVWSEARIELRSRPEATFVQIRRNGKGCLSYLFGSQGEASVVDPSVGIGAYREVAARHGLEIVRVFETHVHADHLSRARELCETTGALLTMPPNRRVTFPFTQACDLECFVVGGLSVEVVATPGHTSESVSYLVNGEVLLTGDTLFVDAVGRPDLEHGDRGAADGARMLYRSLHERLLPCRDEVMVYPAHHATPLGFDGRPIGAALGTLRRLDLVGLGEEQFVQRIVSGLGEKPGNFATIIAVNEGKAALGDNDPLDLEAGPNGCAAR